MVGFERNNQRTVGCGQWRIIDSILNKLDSIGMADSNNTGQYAQLHTWIEALCGL